MTLEKDQRIGDIVDVWHKWACADNTLEGKVDVDTLYEILASIIIGWTVATVWKRVHIG
jgi:hypothetical protein